MLLSHMAEARPSHMVTLYDRSHACWPRAPAAGTPSHGFDPSRQDVSDPQHTGLLQSVAIS
jgi:hypothetical protein